MEQNVVSVRKKSSNMEVILLKTSDTSRPDPQALWDSAINGFREGDYAKSLRCFQDILRMYPGCSSDVRNWMGCCFYKLGNWKKATMAFQRAVHLDPNCVKAKIALVLLDITDDVVLEFLTVLKTCIANNPAGSVEILDIFRDKCCSDLSLESSLSIVKFILENLPDQNLQSSCAYCLAKRHHILGNYNQAKELYQIAVRSGPVDAVLPLYGLGQMFLHNLQFSEAADCFEKVLHLQPDCVEAMRLLGLIYNRLGRRDKSQLIRNVLRKATIEFPDDFDVRMKYAEEMESVDKEEALAAYLKIFEALKAGGKSTPMDIPLLVNISSVYFLLNDFARCQEFLTLATARLRKEISADSYRSLIVTLLYNQGRVYEALNNLQSAEDAYLKILVYQPAYADANLRLSHIALLRHRSEDAFRWLEEAFDLNPDDAAPLILQGDLLMIQEDYAAACSKYDLALKTPCHAEDTYLGLKCGNACLELLRSGIPMVSQTKKELVEKAFSHFQQVLAVDPTNVYAVNGMGVVLASIGFYDAAAEMFHLVNDCDPCMLDAWVNLGHLYCSQKNYTSAISMYQLCIDRAASTSVEVHLFLSRAFYYAGDLKSCIRTLLIGLHYVPTSKTAKFNLGLSLKAMAIVTLKSHDSGLVAVELAVDDLRTAETIFNDLLTNNDCGLLDAKRLRKEVAVTHSFLNQSSSHLERAHKLDALVVRQQKRTVRLMVSAHQTVPQKTDRLKREAAGSASSSGSKGKMPRQVARVEDCSPVKKRSHKNADLEEGIADIRRMISQAQREPQRKRVKAVVGQNSDIRRRRFAGRKRREQEIELLMVSSDDDMSPRFRPRRRRLVVLPSCCSTAKRVSRVTCNGSSDGSSAVEVSESEILLFVKPSALSTDYFQLPARHDSISQKRSQSSSEKPMVLKRFFKSLSDETISWPITGTLNAGVGKRTLSEGDTVLIVAEGERPSGKTIRQTDSFDPDSARVTQIASPPDSDDSAKRHNTESEPEYRKRKSSVRVIQAD